MVTNNTPATATVANPNPSSADRLMISLLRRNIMACISSEAFTPAERLRTNDSVFQCEDEVQLVRWHRNVYRVAAEREKALRLSFADGSAVVYPVAA